MKEQRFMRAMGKARSRLRKSGEYPDADFYETQARFMGEYLGEPAEQIKERVIRLIYRGWEPYFNKINLFPHARETLDTFRNAGIKLGLLSDFPPENKLINLGIRDYWKTVLCSEELGRLKPDELPFLELARQMESPPEQILYVGNSVSYDIEGAKKAGMKTALIRPQWKRLSKAGTADFVFFDYRQLSEYVLS
jgi:putative hydrolase of the HAD superfamily